MTDSFGVPLRLSTRENKIFLSEPVNSSSVWISDRSRLFFEGAFNKQHVKKTKILSWWLILNQLKCKIYFFEHLQLKTKFSNNKNLLFVVKRISLESLNILQQLENRFSYISLRSDNQLSNCVNSEKFYRFSQNMFDVEKLRLSSLMILIGVDTRNENSLFNLVLRQRILKGNFSVINIGPELNLSLPAKTLGSTSKSLITLSEGVNLWCQTIVKAKAPVFVTNSQIFKIPGFKNTREILEKSQKACKSLSSLAVLPDKIEVSGLNNLKLQKPFTAHDFKISSFLYFYNADVSLSNELKKLVNLRVLNLENSKESVTGAVFNQSDFIEPSTSYNFNFTKSSYSFLPSKNLFEDTATYQNLLGNTKKIFKIVDSGEGRKSNWQILRYVYKELNKINYLFNKKNTKLVSTVLHSQLGTGNYFNFIYNPTRTLTSYSSWVDSNTCGKFLTLKLNFKNLSYKVNLFKIRYWLDDFFVGGNKDSLSQNSNTLLKCSQFLKKSSTNFF